MQHINYYDSPLGRIVMSADDIGITGLWFEGQKHAEEYLENEHDLEELLAFKEAKRWLDTYFSGNKPNFTPTLHFCGTDFQREVWRMLLDIPYGSCATYGYIAKKLAEKLGTGKMSAQAVGGAVGKNRISIIVPCHRVLGANGTLTGYAGGLERKNALLKLECIIANKGLQK